MGLLNKTKRVDLGDGEWVEVKTLSTDNLRSMRAQVAEIEPLPGEEKEEAQGFELQQIALSQTIVAWSDEAPPIPENIKQLAYDDALKIQRAIGLADEEVPLPDGPSSVDTSKVNLVE